MFRYVHINIIAKNCKKLTGVKNGNIVELQSWN